MMETSRRPGRDGSGHALGRPTERETSLSGTAETLLGLRYLNTKKYNTALAEYDAWRRWYFHGRAQSRQPMRSKCCATVV
jgi:hypothetical protein